MHLHVDRWYAVLLDRMSARDRRALITEKRAVELADRAHAEVLHERKRDQEDAEVAWLESIPTSTDAQIAFLRAQHDAWAQ